MTTAAAPDAAAAIDYDGRRFRPMDSQQAPAGAQPPVGRYHQQDDLVWAEFSGPGTRVGRLVGIRRPDGTIDGTYCIVSTAGETIAGACVSTPTVLADGRVLLAEHWRRLDGSSGISHIEEITE